MREETNHALHSMLDDMQKKLFAEISSEKKERQKTEETLIKLLEETCSRVESGLRGVDF